MNTEIVRTLIQKFKGQSQPTIIYVSEAHRAAALEKFGVMVVETKHMVIVLKEKLDADGGLTKRAARFTAADVALDHARKASTFVSCIYSSSVRAIFQDSVQPVLTPRGLRETRLDFNDVPGRTTTGRPPSQGSQGDASSTASSPQGWPSSGTLSATHGAIACCS